MEKKLNIDIPKSIAEFEALINKILPKRIFYKTLFRGKGLEFDGYREFGPDEDASLIDWKASVRANSLLTRQYVQERDMKFMFLIDVSENMIFGSQDKLKCEYSAELAAALSYIIVNTGDRLGFAFFNQDIISIKMPESGIKQFDVFAYNLSNPESYGGRSDIGNSVEKFLEMINPSISLIIIVSDFLSMKESDKEKFERLGNIFECFAVIVRDPLDKTLPDIDKEIVIENPETGERMLVNPRIAKRAYEENAETHMNLVKNILVGSNIDFVELETSDDFAYKLAVFLKNRSEKRD